MRHLPGQKLLFVLLAAVVAAAAAGSVAYATGVVGTDNSGTVTVCVKQDTRNARFINAWSHCRPGEVAVLLQAALSTMPTQFTARCDKGQNLGSLLDQIANGAGTQPVTITVYGNCGQDVSITRDFVTLQGGNPTATIRSVSIDGARGAALQNLRVGNGIMVTSGSLDVRGSSIARGVSCEGGLLRLTNADVFGSPDDGVDAWGTCHLTMNGGRVHDNGSFGVAAWESSSVRVQDGAVIMSNRRGGALAQSGGSLWINDSTIRDNGWVGISGYMGGHINVSRSTVVRNAASGLSLTGGSSGGIDATTFRNNANSGVEVMDTSVLTGNGGNTINGNHDWGVWCQPAPATAQISGWSLAGLGTVSGNGAGQVSCPLSGQNAMVTVNCASGEKLGNALGQVADRSEPVVFFIQGTCDEQVQITRDDVAVRSGSPGAGIRGVGLYEVRAIELSGLAIGSGGLHATASTFDANGIHVSGGGGVWLNDGSVGFLFNATVEGATQTGVMVQAGSKLSMNGGTITGSSTTGITVSGSYASLWNVQIANNRGGVEIQFGGMADLGNCTVEQNAFTGVHTFDGGEANVGQTLIQGNGQAGVIAQSGDINLQNATIRDNAIVGVMGINGARVTLQGATVVENNHGGGLALQTGSSAELQGSIVIRQNDGHGVFLQDNSVASSSAQTQVVDNTGWGVWCDSNGLVRGFVGVSGNGQGQVGCTVSP